MTRYTINTTRDLRKYKDTWLEAFANHRGIRHPFIDFDWVSTYCEYFLNNKKLQTYIYNNKGNIAILPFYFRNRGYKELNPIGRGLSDYSDIITNTNDLFWLGDIFKRVDSVKLSRVRDDSPLCQGLNTKTFEGGNSCIIRIENSVKSPYIDIRRQSQGDYFNSLGKKFLREIARRTNLLESLGELKFGYCENSRQLTQVLEVMYSQHIKRRECLGQNRSIFLNRKVRDFYSEVSKKLFLSSKLLLFYLMVNGDVIAVAVCFVYDKNVYYYLNTFDLKFAKYGPSKILIHNIIRYSFINGLDEFDFMIGIEDYKLDWNAKIRQTHNVSLFKNNILGRLALLNCKAESIRTAIKQKLVESRMKKVKQAMFRTFYRLTP